MPELVSYYPRQNRSGKWVYMLKWKDFDGKWKYRSLGHFDQLRAKRQQSRKEAEIRQACEQPVRLRLSQLLAEDLKRTKARHAESTQGMTEARMKSFIDAIGNKYMDDVTYRDCEHFQQWLLEEKGLSPYSVSTYIKMVKAVFSRAEKRDWLGRNPFKGLVRLSIPENEIRIYRPDEFEKLHLVTESRVWQARILLARTAGLRRSEALNLTVNDMDFERGLIHVQPKINTDRTWAWMPKGRERRTVPLDDVVAQLLVDIVTELPEKQPYPLLRPPRYQHLLKLKVAGKLSYRLRVIPDENFNPEFRRLREKAGITDATFHDLRRTCITDWAYSKDLKPQDVQVLAGHRDLATTMKYYVRIERESLVGRARAASRGVLGDLFVARLLRAGQTGSGTQCQQELQPIGNAGFTTNRGDRT